ALHLEDFLFLSYSASQSLQRGNDGMLADALESVIAAIYLDRGFDEVRRFIVERLLPIMMRESLVHDTNFKSLLLETVQGKGYGAPRYVVVKEEGPDHEKHFTVEVVVDEHVVGTGSGRNKKEAEQAAAEAGMAYISTTRRLRARNERPENDAVAS
ncbi:MAG: putative dsRNA-binding protein, partial [Bacteroidota bacterium]